MTRRGASFAVLILEPESMTAEREKRRMTFDVYRSRILGELGYRSAADWQQTMIRQTPLAEGISRMFGRWLHAPGLVAR